MAKSATALDVKVVRGQHELPAIVKDPQKRPWHVVLKPAKGEKQTPGHVIWEVAILLPDEVPLIFASRREAREWTAADRRAQGFNWDVLAERPSDDGEPPWVSDAVDVEQSNSATARFLEYVKANELEDDLQEAFERAHRDGVVRSVRLTQEYGCEPEDQVVEQYLGDWDLLGKGWNPLSCQNGGQQTTLYEETYGWTKSTGRLTPVCISGCFDDIPHDIKSVKVEY
jgi:hypothetical protein